jgi:hypothetical protein
LRWGTGEEAGKLDVIELTSPASGLARIALLCRALPGHAPPPTQRCALTAKQSSAAMPAFRCWPCLAMTGNARPCPDRLSQAPSTGPCLAESRNPELCAAVPVLHLQCECKAEPSYGQLRYA